jgi:glycerate kinase
MVMGANYIKRFLKKQSQQIRFFQFPFFCGEAGTVKTLVEADPRPPMQKPKTAG